MEDELIAFLNGEGELDGKMFGDKDERGRAFWWRKYLPTAKAKEEPGREWFNAEDACAAVEATWKPKAKEQPLPQGDGVAEEVWPLFGYAPGNYTSRCYGCDKVIDGADKNAISCLECAVLNAKTALHHSEERDLAMKAKELPASIDGDGEQFGFPLTAEGIEETRQLCGLIDAETAEQFIRAMAKMWGCSPGFAAHHIKQDKRTEAAEARAAFAMKAKELPLETVERVLPCDVQLPPATTIRAGCKLSTLIHALELRGMSAAIASMGDDGLREALKTIASQAVCYGMRADESELRDWLRFISETAETALARTSLGTDGGELP